MEETITMDAAGRIVIPASVRRELALVGGSELVLGVEGGAIHLRPLARAQVERRAGRLIVTSPLSGAVPDHRDLRDERLGPVSGREK
jgi:AbrB family looped-hinge helix DNA binding protein